ncbi:MAG: TolC family outer membrane protein [Alphaproteobacteria bacterium]|nr:TolC family outer membrane protein [Alphaproteobacteria bacterium]
MTWVIYYIRDGLFLNTEEVMGRHFCRYISDTKLIGMCLLLGTATMLPTESSAETLAQALSAAYNTNPTLAAERAQLRATDEGVSQAVSDWRPTAELTSDYKNSWSNTKGGTSLVGNNHTKTVDAGAKVTQNIYKGGRTTSGIRQAEANVGAGRSKLLNVEQKVFVEAIGAFLQVIRDIEVVDLRVNDEQRLARQHESVQARFELGDLTRTDVAQSKASLSKSKAARRQAEGELEVSRANYERIIGMPAGGLETPAVATDLPKTLDQAIEITVQNNPSVTNAVFAQQSAKEGIEQAEGTFLPTVNMSGTADRLWLRERSRSRTNSATFSVGLSVPLDTSGVLQSKLRQAHQSSSQARLQYEAARNEAIEATIKAWENYFTAEAKIQPLEDQVEASTIAYEGSKLEEEVGNRTIFEVLEEKQKLIQAHVELVDANRVYRLAAYELMSAMGVLTAENLGLAVDKYDPNDHYDDVSDRWMGLGTKWRGKTKEANDV